MIGVVDLFEFALGLAEAFAGLVDSFLVAVLGMDIECSSCCRARWNRWVASCSRWISSSGMVGADRLMRATSLGFGLQKGCRLRIARAGPITLGRTGWGAWTRRGAVRLATTVMSSAASTGLATWIWKPARRARMRSSARAKAVRATAGVRPPSVGGEGADAADEFVAVLAGHADVADEDVGAVAWRSVEGLGGGGGGGDAGAAARRGGGGRGRGRRARRRRRRTREAGEVDAGGRTVRRRPGRRAGGGGVAARVVGVRCGGASGRATTKVAPGPAPGLVARDGAAVELDELLDDGEAEAEAAVAAGGGAVGLAEAVEDVGEELGRDALAGVGDGDFDVGVDAAEEDLDAAALGA